MPEMQVRMAEYKAELFIQKLDVIFIHFNKIGIIIFMNSNKDWLWKLFCSDLSYSTIFPNIIAFQFLEIPIE